MAASSSGGFLDSKHLPRVWHFALHPRPRPPASGNDTQPRIQAQMAGKEGTGTGWLGDSFPPDLPFQLLAH